MSASPGIRNFPVASRLRAPRGIAVEPDGPSVAIRSPAISNVISGFGGEPVASITVTWVSGSPRSRSEEHTSELQSHSDLVCGLLLGKKKRRGSYWFGARQGRHGRHAGNRVRLAGPCA